MTVSLMVKTQLDDNKRRDNILKRMLNTPPREQKKDKKKSKA